MLEDFGWDYDDIGYYVSLATDNTYNSFKKMPPEYIESLIDCIRKDVEEA